MEKKSFLRDTKLSIIRKLAFPCGIAGCVWTVLFSALLVMFIPGQGRVVVTEITEGQTRETITSIIESTMNSGDLSLLVLACLSFVMGVLALVAILSLKKRPYLRNTLMWLSTSIILVVGVFVGVLLPAVILLAISAIGMRESSEIPVEVAVKEG